MKKKSTTSHLEFHPIRIAHRDELWALAIRSKAHWNYPAQFMIDAKPLLKISALQIGQGWGEIAAESSQWAGFFFILPSFGECQLEHLWVDPEWIGKGVGKQLLDRAIQSVRNAGFIDTIRVNSDPNAEGFYLMQGFTRAGEIASEIEGARPLPVLTLRV